MTGERLRPQAVSLVLTRANEASGLNPDTFSGHSLRAGLSTAAALAGADLKDIMAQTRHRSHDIALRYIRRAEIWKNNVTKLLFSPPAINEAQSSISITYRKPRKMRASSALVTNFVNPVLKAPTRHFAGGRALSVSQLN
jgi:hypothetical protein